MTPTIEEAIEIIQKLPPPDRAKLFDWAEEEKRRESVAREEKINQLKRKNEKFKLALQWLEENKEEFDGKFVVLDGNELVACGTDSKTVYDEARAKGYTSPFLTRVKAKTLPFGGW